MKRIFTSLALLCATLFTLHAQDCVFQYEGKPLEDGATVTINAAPDALFRPEAENVASGVDGERAAMNTYCDDGVCAVLQNYYQRQDPANG